MVENEIQYVPWGQFRQMVPSILRLEVTRLTQYLAGEETSDTVHNLVVRVRYDVRRFIDCIAGINQETAEDTGDDCRQLLTSALLNASLLPEHPQILYVIDRLKYVRDRMPYIY